ncbi:MAG: hypothetical protein AB1714_29975 [Acidobacteriota bacterium]
MYYFDLDSAARDAGLEPERLKALCDSILREFPRDEMLYELHVLRACMALRNGDVSFEELVPGEKAANAAAQTAGKTAA